MKNDLRCGNARKAAETGQGVKWPERSESLQLNRSLVRNNGWREQKCARRRLEMSGRSVWHATCHLMVAMRRRSLIKRWVKLKQAKAYAALSCTLLLAVTIPAPHHHVSEGNIFTVVGSDYVSPLISSPRGIQTLNVRLSSFARFVGYDQIHSLVDTGSTRQLAKVTRYSGEIFSVLNVEFVLRDKPGAFDHPVYISEEFWKRVLGATPDVLGLSFEAGGELHQIAGVVRSSVGPMLDDTEVWVPFSSRGPYGESTLLRVFGEQCPGADWKAGEKKLGSLIQTQFIKDQIIETETVHLLPLDRKMIVETREEHPEV
jgi:hypothetical protein